MIALFGSRVYRWNGNDEIDSQQEEGKQIMLFTGENVGDEVVRCFCLVVGVTTDRFRPKKEGLDETTEPLQHPRYQEHSNATKNRLKNGFGAFENLKYFLPNLLGGILYSALPFP
jgi:hypothetical protein